MKTITPPAPTATGQAGASPRPLVQGQRAALNQELPAWAGELTKVRPLCNRERLAIYAYKAAWSGERNI